MLNFALLVSVALGFILPSESADMRKDNNWRIIFAVPGIVAIVQITLLLTVFKHGPLTFAISHKRFDEASS